ncbi:MAG: dihydrodipicolinate reductase C-terminal domain-containing protein, partial [Bacteroidota bacterium]
MRITLLGYGKMGQAIEKEALQRGHQISHRIDQHNYEELASISQETTDVVIEFTHQASFEANVRAVLAKSLPLVAGTTGWYDRIDKLKKEVEAAKGSFMYASNFSVGVNLFFKLNQRLAELMNPHPSYDPYLEEQHHRHKADGPSGTAHTLARDLIERLDRKTHISDEQLQRRAPQNDELSVSFSRAGE